MRTLLKNLSSTTTRRSVSLWSTFMKAAAWRALRDGRCRAGYPRWSSRHFQVMHKLPHPLLGLGSGVWRAETDQTPEPQVVTSG